jgi:hypothetical protein
MPGVRGSAGGLRKSGTQPNDGLSARSTGSRFRAVLSGGRAMLGLGAAWNKREHDGLGVPFPPVKQRLEQLEETLQICAQRWSDDDGPYEGKHFRLAETICEPRPAGPQILVGGGGERQTLRMVARYADACNLFASDPSSVRRKLGVLDRHCADAGRGPASVTRTISAFGAGPFAGDFLSTMETYAAMGIEQVSINPDGPDPVAWVSRVTEDVLPKLADL